LPQQKPTKSIGGKNGNANRNVSEGLPLVTFALQSDQLNAMAESGQFASIVEDKLSKPFLTSSGNVIDVPQLHAIGARGANQTVAILDTGVDIDHPFLNTRVVEGACFSSNFAGHGATSLCPGGVESATTLASGNHCSGVNGCDHGTHVAGIAAGRASGTITRTGVAPDADIMAVLVFSRFDDVPGGPNTCAGVGTSSPCILSYDSDQIEGLQRVLNRANALNVVSVNMSLGGGSNTGTCDTTNAIKKSIIDQLLTQDVVTAIASGNGSDVSQISAPGCISTAVTVSSTTDTDIVSNFSNMSDTVDLLAPGSIIMSSVPGTLFADKSGTSMATPQVAGAFAALASCVTNPSTADILVALENSGVSITDSRPGGSVTKNRIDLDAAAAALGCVGVGVQPHQVGIQVEDPNRKLRNGDSMWVRAFVTVGGVPAANRTVNFSSATPGRLSVAPAAVQTNNQGVAEATVTSHTSTNRDTVVITAEDSGVTATTAVRVPDLSYMSFALLLGVLGIFGLLYKRRPVA